MSKLLQVLRWVGFIPLALVGAFLGSGFVNLISITTFGPNWLTYINSGLLSAGGFYLAGMFVAPSRVAFVKWLLISVLSIYWAVIVYLGLSYLGLTVEEYGSLFNWGLATIGFLLAIVIGAMLPADFIEGK